MTDDLHEWRSAAYRFQRERDEARMWARHGYEIGQRSNTWTDHGVAPAWLTEGHAEASGVEDVAMPTAREIGDSLGFALAAMQPRAEPVFCHHENARRSTRETMQAGWGRNTIVRLDCPVCHEWAERVNGEPILAPKVINVSRCTEACTEQHTYRDGCLMAPDWSKPILRSEP